jgi:hypothetical protein
MESLGLTISLTMFHLTLVLIGNPLLALSNPTLITKAELVLDIPSKLIE